MTSSSFWSIANLSPTFAGLATLVSVFAVIVTAVIGVRRSNHMQTQTFTMTVMLQLLTTDRFCDAYALVMRQAERNTKFDPATLSQREDELLASLLSMYEFIAINSMAGTIDKTMVLRQRLSGFVRTFEICEDFIRHKRVTLDRPNVYRSFEAFVAANATLKPVPSAGSAPKTARH